MSHNNLRPLQRYALEHQESKHPVNTGGTYEKERTRDYRHYRFRG